MWTELYAQLQTKLEGSTNPLEGSVSYGDKTIQWRSYADLISLMEYTKKQSEIENATYSRRVYAKQVGRYED